MPPKQRLVEKLTQELSCLADAESATAALAKSHYENFLVASIFLPRNLRQPFYNVYAFCRIADDLADQSPSPEIAKDRLNRFRDYLQATFDDAPPSNLFLALRSTIKQFNLAPLPFTELLDAFQQDQVKFRYKNFDEVLSYCQKSANPVGQIVLKLAGCVDSQAIALSDKICTGLQLANHWQDVARDYAIGRIYLPQDGWDQFGVSESMFSEASTPTPIRRLVESECNRAERFFQEGLPLADQVPRWLASDVKLFAHGGMATLNAVRKIDFDILAHRPQVSRWQQIAMVGKAIMGRL